MRTIRRDNIPLPNLSLPRKAAFTLLLAGGLLVYLGTWFYVLHAVYASEDSDPMTLFGVGLGVLAQHDFGAYSAMFTAHVLSLLALLAGAYFLFALTSIRRKAKSLIAAAAILLALLDFFAWYRAPSCSATNLYVGWLGVLSGLPLAFLALAPLFQMWIYRRWNSGGKRTKVVIVGGGFAGLYAAMGLNRRLGYHRDLEITLLDRKNYFLFPPLLPSAAAGTIETRQVSYPFRRIFETTNILFRKVAVKRIDPAARTVHGLIETNEDPATGEPVAREAGFEYDYLILAPGSAVQTFGTKGADKHAFFMRELNDAVKLRNHVIDCFERAAVLEDGEAQRELLRFVIVGAGPTGLETATEIHDLIHEVLLKRYPEIGRDLPEVCILQSGDAILPGWHKDIVQISARQLEKMKISIHYGARVSEVGPNSVTFGETRLLTRSVVWCAGVKPCALLNNCGLALHSSGRAPVEDDLRSKEFPNVFVLGDAAYLVDRTSERALPPLGQVAFQQGSHTAKNLTRLLRGAESRPFKYFDFGGLVSVGEHFAAVNLLGVRVSGFIGWVIWRTLYLAKLVGFSNKIRVMIDWTLDLMIERSISQIRDSEEDGVRAKTEPAIRAVA